MGDAWWRTLGPPVLVAELFPGEREGLLAVLASLSAAEWDTPTACAGWSVHDVALHLLGGDIGIIASRRDGYRRRDTVGRDLSQWDDLVAFIDAQNGRWVEATRRISPRLLTEFLRMTGDAISAHFASLDPQARGGPVNWAGAAPAPVWLDTAREYTERWHHQQHIRDAVERPGLMERRWLAPVLETFVRALPHTLRAVDAPDGTALRLVVTGAAGGAWRVARMEGEWRLAADTGAADATVTMDEATAWRRWTTGLSRAEAMARARIEGDTTLARAPLDMLSIIA